MILSPHYILTLSGRNDVFHGKSTDCSLFQNPSWRSWGDEQCCYAWTGRSFDWLYEYYRRRVSLCTPRSWLTYSWALANDRYRRGKSQSNDVDIVITHTDAKGGAAKIKGLCKKFVRRLYQRGQSEWRLLYTIVNLIISRPCHPCHACALICSKKC